MLDFVVLGGPTIHGDGYFGSARFFFVIAFVSVVAELLKRSHGGEDHVLCRGGRPGDFWLLPK